MKKEVPENYYTTLTLKDAGHLLSLSQQEPPPQDQKVFCQASLLQTECISKRRNSTRGT